MAGLMLAVLAGPFLLATSARASCGDYVIRNGSALEKGSQVTSLQPLPMALVSSHLPFHSKDRTPCHGPNCSRGPGQAPLTPVVLAPAPSNQSAWLPPQMVVPANGDRATWLREPSFRPVERCYRIERPPRLFLPFLRSA